MLGSRNAAFILHAAPGSYWHGSSMVPDFALDVPWKSTGESLIVHPLDFWGHPADAGLVHDHHGRKSISYRKSLLHVAVSTFWHNHHTTRWSDTLYCRQLTKDIKRCSYHLDHNEVLMVTHAGVVQPIVHLTEPMMTIMRQRPATTLAAPYT